MLTIIKVIGDQTIDCIFYEVQQLQLQNDQGEAERIAVFLKRESLSARYFE